MNDLMQVIVGDARAGLAELPEKCCQACITSPPYLGLRDYQIEGQIGMEKTADEYVANIVLVMAGVGRALKDDGLLWLNLGDSYSTGTAASKPRHDADGKHEGMDGIISRPGSPEGCKPKDMMEIPSLVAIAMRNAGWYLRSRIPWIKRNPMPEPVTDRPSSGVEYVFLFSKSNQYYYDAEAVAQPISASYAADNRPDGVLRQKLYGNSKYIKSGMMDRKEGEPTDYEPRSTTRSWRNSDLFFQTWQGLLTDDDLKPLALVVNTGNFRGAHFATFPEKLVQPMILASTKPGDVVLDPFAGAFTTAYTALRLRRKAIAIELNPEFAEMGKTRCAGEMIEHIL